MEGHPIQRVVVRVTQPIRALQAGALSDRRRGSLALLVGTATVLINLYWLSRPEAMSMGALVAMLIDLYRLVLRGVQLDASQTRQLFVNLPPNRRRLLSRTVFFAFLSMVVLSVCVHDLKSHQGSLPNSIRVTLFFAALFTTWLELHLGFAVYYAKAYFDLNPDRNVAKINPQVFIFPGTDEPIFTDFLYVAYSVGLTFAMSDVDLEDGFTRRTVLGQAIVSFLFYSTIFSVITNLMIG